MSPEKTLRTVVAEVEAPYNNLDFLPIRLDGAFMVYELQLFVHNLIANPNRTPEELKNLAIVKLAFQRLPRTTPGVHICLGVVLRNGNESNCCDLEISDSRSSISTGGNVYDPGVGSDSFSNTLFECESSGFRDGAIDAFEIGSWQAAAQELLNCGATLSFENYCEEAEIGWDSTFESDPWEELNERIRR